MKYKLDKQNPHKLSQTGKIPLEVSLHGGGVALVRAHFSQADPGEGVNRWDVRQGHSVEVQLWQRNKDSKREQSL